MMFKKLWFRANLVGAKVPFLVDLSAVSAIGEIEPFKVALLIDGDWQHFYLRADDNEAPDPVEYRLHSLIEEWKEARVKLHHPVYVGTVETIPYRGK
jgi:hypothetical protein